MKKRLIFVLGSILIVLMAAVMLFAANASEVYQEYGLYIGGTPVTSKNLSGSGWHFEPETNTLVLNGFEITSGGYCHQKINDGTTWLYSFIYVEDSKSMNLTIRTEGKESTIGYGALAGKNAVSAGDGTYNSYFGIYNKNGNVTITGSARLYIYTNQLCIYTAKKITVDECHGGVSMYAHVNGIKSKDLIVKGGSQVSVTCGYSGGDDYQSAITASRSISLYDTSELRAEVERRSDSTKGYISAISCQEGTINVYGGKLTATCYMGGKQSDGFPECFAIRVGTLNISGGGVVDAQVKTASGQKDYRRSITIGQYNGSTGTINFKGNGILRVGVEMKNPNGEQRLYPESFNLLNNTSGLSTVLTKDGYDRYLEFTAYEREGIFLYEGSSMHHWSYYRHPTLGGNSYFFLFNLNDAIVSGTDYQVYSVSGTQYMIPYVESGEIPAITVEAGELTLWLRSGETYNFTKPIEVKSGATLKIFGEGIINGLDVTGGGTVIFRSGTVTGKVQKSLKMVVEGGNVNVDYDGQATDANGVKVWRQAYVLGNDDASFSSISQISVRNGRTYSVYGATPIDGRKVFLWMQSPEELESLSVVPSGYSSSLTLKGNPGNPLWLTLFQSIATNERILYVATRGMTVTIRPFATAPTAEQMKEYKLIWSYSDDGLNWTTISNPNCDSECQLTYTVPEGESWINRTFRCELRKTATNEQLGVYTATLHLANLKIVNENPFSENQMVTLRLTEETLPPNGQTVTIEQIRWYISDDGGKTYKLHDPANGKEAYSFKVTTAIDGRVIRCEAKLKDGTTLTNIAVSEPITVEVTDRWVEITQQPESIDIPIPTGTSYTIKVRAEYATSYQWQVSKRTYAGEDVPFEDIPGATEQDYVFKGATLTRDHQYYVYRCVVSNAFSKVISKEVMPNLLFDPNFINWGYNGVVTIREGDNTLFVANIRRGNPIIATDEVYWEVDMKDGKGYVRLSEVEALKGLFTEESFTETADGVTYHIKATLRLDKVPLTMNGYTFRCTLTFGDKSALGWPYFDLKVLTECQQNGHDWSEATCTALSTCSRCGETRGELLPHTGGKATCRSGAICEVCGNAYGDRDWSTHPDGATPVWNVEEWGDNAGHQSKWSCCGQEEYKWEYHVWEEGICTVCGCICEHPINSPANCHKRAWCHTCHIEYDEINPNNHDLYPSGTYLRDQKDPTCTEEGYTGDTVCWNCRGVITEGTVIPANGHSTSLPATCKEKAYCSVCEKHFGDVDPNNHAEPWSKYYVKTETTHEAHWNCCDMVKTEPHDFDEENVCKVCKYGCTKHYGGTATCMEKARCENCDEEYGDLDPNNHEYTGIYPDDDLTHTERCKCGTIISGPERHTWENGVCTVCDGRHRNHTESDWILDEAPIYGRTGSRHKVCTVCDALLTTETLEAVDSEHFGVIHNCAFENDLSMLYAILKSTLEGCADIRLVVTQENGNVIKVLLPTEYSKDGEAYYRFDYTGIAAKEMGDTLTARLEFTRDGVFYSGTVDTYSLKAYAMERLEKSTNAEFKSLLVDLLNYGAAAQTYFGYKTDALVNADLTAEQKALATGAFNLPTTAENDSGENVTYPASITKKNILFGNRITLLIATSLGKDSDLSGISLRIRYTDIDGNEVEKFIGGKDFVFRDDVNSYTAYFDGLKASEFRTQLELTLVKDGEAISETVTYSLDTYAQNRLTASDDASFKALLEATLRYADSAKAYFASTKLS